MVERHSCDCQVMWRETREALDRLLPEAFWEHANNSRSEARAAAKALGRAFRRKIRGAGFKEPPPKQRVEIA